MGCRNFTAHQSMFLFLIGFAFLIFFNNLSLIMVKFLLVDLGWRLRDLHLCSFDISKLRPDIYKDFAIFKIQRFDNKLSFIAIDILCKLVKFLFFLLLNKRQPQHLNKNNLFLAAQNVQNEIQIERECLSGIFNRNSNCISSIQTQK